VLPGAAGERHDIALADELTIIHPQAFLQHERAINLNPDNKAATVRAFVKFHNNMQRAPTMGGFSLLNNNFPPLLLEDAAFHEFNEMSTIGPWIDAQGVLQQDYLIGAGFKGARCVRNGNLGGAATKAASIEREGHMVSDKGKLCITGYHNLGGLGGAVSTAALIKRDGYMINDKGVRTSAAHNRLGEIGVEARDKIARASAMSEHHSHICISTLCQRGASINWEGQNVRLFHLCYDPEQSGLAGQKPQQVRGLGLHVCKKCHRTARSARRLAAWHQHATATASCYANISTSWLFRL